MCIKYPAAVRRIGKVGFQPLPSRHAEARRRSVAPHLPTAFWKSIPPCLLDAVAETPLLMKRASRRAEAFASPRAASEARDVSALCWPCWPRWRVCGACRRHPCAYHAQHFGKLHPDVVDGFECASRDWPAAPAPSLPLPDRPPRIRSGEPAIFFRRIINKYSNRNRNTRRRVCSAPTFRSAGRSTAPGSRRNALRTTKLRIGACPYPVHAAAGEQTHKSTYCPHPPITPTVSCLLFRKRAKRNTFALQLLAILGCGGNNSTRLCLLCGLPLRHYPSAFRVERPRAHPPSIYAVLLKISQKQQEPILTDGFLRTFARLRSSLSCQPTVQQLLNDSC